MQRASTILVVDDSSAVRNILSALLQAAGHHVLTAENVRVGLDILKIHHPDIILTDYNMPGLTGHDFLLAARRDERFDGTPVFVVSSAATSEILGRMDAAGANGWFNKPICAATLLPVIRAVCGALPALPISASTGERARRSAAA